MGEFQNSFTESQKEAVIVMLFAISLADDSDFKNQDETCMSCQQEVIKSAAQLLGFRVVQNTFQKATSKDEYANLFRTLATLSPTNKDWFIISINDLLNCYKNIPRPTKTFIDTLLLRINITPEMFSNAVNKAKALSKKFFPNN